MRVLKKTGLLARLITLDAKNNAVGERVGGVPQPQGRRWLALPLGIIEQLVGDSLDARLTRADNMIAKQAGESDQLVMIEHCFTFQGKRFKGRECRVTLSQRSA